MRKISTFKTFSMRVAMTLLLAVMTSFGAWADDITYTATGGTTGYDYENFENLVDGNKSTKWCVNSGSPYIEFYSSSPITPIGYVMTTAADTYPNNQGRNPKRLIIKAKTTTSDQWTTLADITDNDLVPFKNTTDCTYGLSNTNTYQYFRLEFTSRNGIELQLAEFAFITYTATNGTAGANNNEGYAKLVDGNKSTKWCVTSLGSPTFIDFETSAPIVPKGYILTTGNDTGTNPGRNPKSWVIKAKANSGDSWTTIASVTDDSRMPAANTTDCTYPINNTNSYRYFRFEISAIQSGSTFQLAEFAFLTDVDSYNLSTAEVSGLEEFYSYTSSVITLDYSVTDCFGTLLTKDTHYTATITKDGSTVTEVRDKGNYTLTLTGKGSYSGSRVFNFTVGDFCEVTSSTTKMKNCTYKVTSNVTIGERIQISGTVNLILGEGATLTASDGIEVPSGAKLIIDGTGSLVAQASSGENSGIGSVSYGNITINGGNVTAKGYSGGAGIGGNRNANSGGDIIINGGVVNATGSSFRGNGAFRYSAGIGGGATWWGDDYGYFKSITINGGQVTTDRLGNPSDHNSGTLVMGWTNLTDFIRADVFSAASMSFADGKQFLLDGTTTVATTSNINGKKIVPKKYEIDEATLSGISDSYNYTGSAINLNYTLTYNGNTMVEGTDYTAVITKDGTVVTEIKDAGNYVITFTGMGLYTGTKIKNVSVPGVNMTANMLNTFFFSRDTVFCGYSITPGYALKYNGSFMTENTDYYITKTRDGNVVDEVRNAGNYVYTFTGKGRFIGSFTKSFRINPKNITDAHFSTPSDPVYKPDGSMTYEPYGLYYYNAGNVSTKMTEADYDLTITKDGVVVTEIKNAGTYILTAVGKNNFTGTLTQEYVVDACDLSEDVYVYGLRESYSSSEESNSLPNEWNGGYTLKYMTYLVLTEGTDYEVSVVRDGVPVSGVYGIGNFTLTFTGIGNYKNSRTYNLNVQSYKYMGGGSGGWSQTGVLFSNSKNYSMSQVIYTTEELGCAGLLKRISFYTTSSPSTRTIDIYMTHTDKNYYSARNEWVPVDVTNDLVYSGDIEFLQNSYDDIFLQFPFVYDGQHNVAITLDDRTGSPMPTLFCYYETDLCEVLKGYNDYRIFSPTNPNPANGYGSTIKPKLSVLKEGVPALVRPKDLAIDYQGETSATLTWVEQGLGTAWQIGLDDGTSEQLIDVTTQSYTFTNLAYHTDYAIRVRSTDGNGNYGEWTNAYHLITAFCALEEMCTISFDLTSSMGSTWEGNALEVVDSETGYLFGTITNDSVTGTLYEPLTTHAVLAVAPGRTIDFRLVQGAYPQYCSWTVYDVNGDELWSGKPYYKGLNGVKNYYNTGDILYSYTVDCTDNPYRMPVELTCTSVTATTATLVWREKATATAWRICVNDDETNLIQANDTTYTLTGLTPETVYNVRVQAFGSDGESRWTQNISFQPSDKLHVGRPEDIAVEVPTNVRNYNSLTEQIFLKEELGSAAVFKSIDFYAKNYSSTRKLDIYMVHTDKNHFRVPGSYSYEWVNVTPADKVFSGTVKFNQDVWTTIDLEVPFSYNGQDNLLLVVDDNTGTYTEYNYASLFSIYTSSISVEEDGHEVNSSRTIYYGDNLDPTNLSGASAYSLSYSSEIRLDVVKEGELLRPGFLAASGVTGHTATLSWHENGTATAWQICLNGDEDHLIDVTTNPYTFTELTPETNYTVKVRAVSGNRYSDWSTAVSFYASDKRHIGSGTSYENNVPTGTYCSKFFSEQIYTSEEIGEAGCISSIDFFSQYGTDTRNLDVYMFHTDKSNFSSPSSDWITPTAADKVFSGNVSFSAGTWTTLELDDLFNYDGVSNVVLAVYDKTGRSTNGSPLSFLVYGSNGYQSAYYTYYSGNPEEGISGGSLMQRKNQIRLGYATGSLVPRPKDVVCTAATATTSTIGWTEQGTATAWQICLNGDDLHPIDANTNPFTLTDLTPFEDITVQVRAVSGNAYSDWSKTLRVEAGGLIQVGSGNSADYMVPLYSYVAYSMSEQIYTPADIINAGGSAGSIVRIEFLNTAPGQTRNIDIYMMHTTTDKFEAPREYVPVTQADKVFSGNVTFKTGTWTGIMLDKAFAYDGQSNIALVVDDNTGSCVQGEPLHCSSFSTGNDYQIAYRNSSTDIDPTVENTGNSGGLSPYKNQIRLGITQAAVAGDVNGDGSVTIKDAIAVVNYILTNGHPTGNFVFSAADMNGDKAITISDATAIVDKILKGEE